MTLPSHAMDGGAPILDATLLLDDEVNMMRNGTVTPISGDESGERKDWVSTWPGREDYGTQATIENLKTMLHMETQSYLPCPDYLSAIENAHLNNGTDIVSEAWRRKLCEWCFEVVDHFNFDREVVSFALNYLDRCVAIKATTSSAPLPKRQFQLYAVTCLYLSIKLHGEVDSCDTPRKKLRLGAFVELSRGFFQEDVIEQTEQEILNTLQWRVNPPTTLRFIASLLRLCPQWIDNDRPTTYSMVMGGIYDVARYLTELSLCISSFSFTFKTSTIAYASIICAIEALQPTMTLPYAVRVAFLNAILEASQLHPADQEVSRVCKMLKQLCPSFFSNEEGSIEIDMGLDGTSAESSDDSSWNVNDENEEDGKISPVCVTNTDHFDQATKQESDESPRSHRKRTRSAAAPDENTRPLHRSSC